MLLISIVLQAQFNPQPKAVTQKFFPDLEVQINTPAFNKKSGFTKHHELIAFLNELVQKHPQYISYSYIGQSQKGKDIPLVRISDAKSTKPKLRFWIQAGIHGNEPASTEGVLCFIEQLLNNSANHKYLADFDFGIIPMANIDGYEKQDRYAANGLDLNRDQTKFTAPESGVLKKAFSDFNADIAMDFHEYRPYRRDYMQMGKWGYTGAYDVMFLYSGNLNVPEVLRNYTQSKFVKAAEMRMDANGFSHHNYFSAGEHYGELQLNEGSSNARSSATSYALSNCISTLVEVRGVALGRTSFKRRTYITYQVAMSYLEYAFANQREVHQILDKSRQQTNAEVVITAAKGQYTTTVKMINSDNFELENVEMLVNDAWQSKAKNTRAMPFAYLILPGNPALTARLAYLGIEMAEVTKAQAIEVESYEVVDYFRNAEKYEGVHQQRVQVRLATQKINIPVGTLIIYTNQPRIGLAVEVLEPETPNSFVSFGVLPTQLGAELPVYRYLKTEKLD